MHLQCEPLAALGTRHGIVLDPVHRGIRIARFDRYSRMPLLPLGAGAVIGGKRYIFPLGGRGRPFDFYDMRLSPCTIRWIGIHAAGALKFTLTFVTPFRPRDAEFSTIPILAIRLEVAPLAGHFRWEPIREYPRTVTLFLEPGGSGFLFQQTSPQSGDLRFDSCLFRQPPQGGEASCEEIIPQLDRFVTPDGHATSNGFQRTVAPASGQALTLAWCVWNPPLFEVQGRRLPFRYARRFASLDAVAMWAALHTEQLFENARRVDGIIQSHNLGPVFDALLAQTLHSWLLNTWWLDRQGRDWFSVWEGNCHFHSTIDVEFTQVPFYLTLWPELLGFELEFWPKYAKPGTQTLGSKGRNTLFQSHDVGAGASANGQAYHHEMEVEETANYLLLLFLHWRRTGDFRLVRQQRATWSRYLAFLRACDSTGDGIPDQGVANTIDDASPALQFGKRQTYLAVKCLGAWTAAAAMWKALGHSVNAQAASAQARRIRRVIEAKGWRESHYAVLLDPEGKGVRDPWTGEIRDYDEIPGWDSPHIYTANTLAPLDMVGTDLGLSPSRLQHDLRFATDACLREYGCVHSNYTPEQPAGRPREGLVGAALNPGWISMNMLRDIAAFYRRVDLRPLLPRYWNWQTTVNTQGPFGFFETFSGNNLHLYPRGVAVWGFFEALAGRAFDAVTGRETTSPPFPSVRVPLLLNADWENGTAQTVES